MQRYWVYFIFLSLFFVGCSEKPNSKLSTSIEDTKTDTIKTIAGLSWYLNIETALEKGKEEKKNIIVMVGEDSCRWCKKMKEQTLTDKQIQDRLKAYILVSVKRSDKDALKYLNTFDGNIPSFFFMQDNKELIESIVGYFKADDFLDYINEIEE